MQKHTSNNTSSYPASSTGFLTAIRDGHLNLPTDQDQLNAHTKEITSGITGIHFVDNILKSDQQRLHEDLHLDHARENVAKKTDNPLTDLDLVKEADSGGRSTPTRDVLLAVQAGTVSVETASFFLKGGSNPMFPKSDYEVYEGMRRSATQMIEDVHQDVPASDQAILTSFRDRIYVQQRIDGHAKTRQRTALFGNEHLASFRDRQLRDLEFRSTQTMRRHSQTSGAQGASNPEDDLKDVFKTIENFASQQIDKLKRMGVANNEIRTTVVGSIQSVSMDLPNNSEIAKAFVHMKETVCNNIERQIQSRKDMRSSGFSPG